MVWDKQKVAQDKTQRTRKKDIVVGEAGERMTGRCGKRCGGDEIAMKFQRERERGGEISNFVLLVSVEEKSLKR